VIRSLNKLPAAIREAVQGAVETMEGGPMAEAAEYEEGWKVD
jgi:hypothetical protein